MISRLTTFAAIFAVLTTTTLALAATSAQRAQAERNATTTTTATATATAISAAALPAIHFDTVVVTGHRAAASSAP